MGGGVEGWDWLETLVLVKKTKGVRRNKKKGTGVSGKGVSYLL